MLPILDGLEAIHKQGFLHRDIKPQNIYLTDKGIPILLDFGASRFAVADSNQTLTVMLSAGYAPFEQYHQKGKQGPWTDIYSCGATLFFMVTGVKPSDAIERQHEDTQLSAVKYNPQLSESFGLSIVKALSTNPLSRPQNIIAFKQIISGNSYLPSIANQAESNTQFVLLPVQSVSAKKPDRQSVIIQYNTNQSALFSNRRVFYFAVAAIILWLGLDFRQFSDESTSMVLEQEINQQQFVEESVILSAMESIDDQNGNSDLARLNSGVNINHRNIENVQMPPLPSQSNQQVLPIYPPYQQRGLESAQPFFISTPKPQGIPQPALTACRYKKQHVKCQFDWQGEWLNGICLPIEYNKLACFPEPHALRSKLSRPKYRH